MVSGRDEDLKKGVLFIHQDAAIYGGVIAKNTKIIQNIKHEAYILVSNGKISIDGKILKKGDGAEITEEKSFEISAQIDSEILVIDVP